MADEARVVQCRQCGCSFLPSSVYRDWLARRGIDVVVPLLCPPCFSKAGPIPKQRGQVKWFNPRRHYGFIVTEEGEEVFFRQQQIVGDDAEDTHKGQAVRFHIRYAERGPQALNVELVGE